MGVKKKVGVKKRGEKNGGKKMVVWKKIGILFNPKK